MCSPAGDGTFGDVVIRHDPAVVGLTSPVNASGVFELDVHSDMLLPFEGSGVDTTWELRLPPAANPFDLGSVVDVADHRRLHRAARRGLPQRHVLSMRRGTVGGEATATGGIASTKGATPSPGPACAAATPIGDRTLGFGPDAAALFDASRLEDVLLVVSWAEQAASWT